MLSYCLKCKKTEIINPKVLKTNNMLYMVVKYPKYAICGSKKSRFIKKQEAKGFLINIGFSAPLNKIPILGDVLF